MSDRGGTTWTVKFVLNFIKSGQSRRHRFLNPFPQLPAVKKNSKNGAPRKFYGPSYVDPALVTYVTNCITNATEYLVVHYIFTVLVSIGSKHILHLLLNNLVWTIYTKCLHLKWLYDKIIMKMSESLCHDFTISNLSLQYLKLVKLRRYFNLRKADM